jgi:hypothetical protein
VAKRYKLFHQQPPKPETMKTKITKKLFLLLVLTCWTTNSIAQNKWDTKERNYSGGVVLSGIIDVVQAKVLGVKPTGKNVYVNYDPFYDKYVIDWMEDDGAARMTLKFKEENSGGKMYIDTYSPKSSAYFVHEHISDEHRLTLMSSDPVMLEGKKVKMIIIFDDLN